MAVDSKPTNLLALFASSSTLICCALPALFIALGAGATLASLVSAFPFLVTLSRHKVAISLAALAVLAIAGVVHYRVARQPCPADPELGRLCLKTRKRGRAVYYFSVGIFALATLFTYALPELI